MTAHPIDTEALRRLADAATPGPWDYPGKLLGLPCTTVFAGDPKRTQAVYLAAAMPENGAFIAAARTAVPALLDENAALRARIKAVREPHQPDGHDPEVCGEPDCFASCIEDGMEWPCDTIRALDGTVTPPDAG